MKRAWGVGFVRWRRVNVRRVAMIDGEGVVA